MINKDKFFDWLNERFGPENIKIRNTSHGEEICVNSPWAESFRGRPDTKYHLWINLTGGKRPNPYGAYRCWLTDKHGNIISLVSELDGISYEEARNKICDSYDLTSLEQRVHEFFEKKYGAKYGDAPEESSKETVRVCDLPQHCYLIDELKPDDFYMKIRAKRYLANRKIPTKGLYVCIDGEYENRILIPYYDKNGNLVFYNARLISGKGIKYKKPSSSQGAHVFMTSWPKIGEKVYVMEGEFDAITLSLCGKHACALGGKSINKEQLNVLLDYTIVLAFDADEAGKKATLDMGNLLLEHSKYPVYFVRPPKQYKDWNKFYVCCGKDIVNEYINKYEMLYTPEYQEWTRIMSLTN